MNRVGRGSEPPASWFQSISNRGGRFKPSPIGVPHAAANFGDGTGVAPLTLGSRTFALAHRYDEAGDFTVTIRLCDDDGGCGTVVHQVRVAPTPGSPNPGPGVVGAAGWFVWPGSRDLGAMTIYAGVTRSGPVGAFRIDRFGPKAASIGGVTLESGAVWTEGETRIARFIGGGTMTDRAGRKLVRVEVVVLDLGVTDRIFIKVSRLNGTAVPELSFRGEHPSGSLPLQLGTAVVEDR